MRATIIIFTVLLYYPTVVFIVQKLCKDTTKNAQKLIIISLFLNMPLVLHIDYLNTQINALHLCTFLFAYYFTRERQFTLATIFACLSMLSKQIVLPLALPIGFYALACSIKTSIVKKENTRQVLFIYICSTFLAIYSNFDNNYQVVVCRNCDDFDSYESIFHVWCLEEDVDEDISCEAEGVDKLCIKFLEVFRVLLLPIWHGRIATKTSDPLYFHYIPQRMFHFLLPLKANQ